LSQEVLLVAVQVQPEGHVTLTLPLPPVDVYEAELAERVYVHATPVCVTVNVFPPMVSVPVCDRLLVLAATE
jgi:hypothetical protein